MTLKIDVQKKPDYLLVQLAGHVNGETSGALERECLALIANKPAAMILDLTDVPYISSAGLYSVLLAGKEIDAAGGKLLLCGLKGPVKDVFRFAGFDAIFSIFDTLEAAVPHALRSSR